MLQWVSMTILLYFANFYNAVKDFVCIVRRVSREEGGQRACPPPPPRNWKVMRAWAILPIFCYFFSRKYHFLSYFLSSPPPEKLKSKKKGFQILSPPPSLRIPGHAADSLQNSFNVCVALPFITYKLITIFRWKGVKTYTTFAETMHISVKRTYTTLLLLFRNIFIVCALLLFLQNYFLFRAILEISRYARNLSWPHISYHSSKK